MDEVDNIIIHSLRQIGCNIDEEHTSLTALTPDILVESAAKCLQLIEPSLDIPKSLPPGIAQRYSVTTSLAEACTAVGFRGDIGYQTFLYSNVIEVRRVFMFLIERLPKEAEKLRFDGQPKDVLKILENEIAQNIGIQMSAPWTPQYCKKFGIRKFGNVFAVQASNNGFLPKKLNIPHASRLDVSHELKQYWLKRSPSVFQQTRSSNLCASLIHKNDFDVATIDSTSSTTTAVEIVNSSFQKLPQLEGKSILPIEPIPSQRSTKPIAAPRKDNIRNIKSVQQLKLDNIEIPNENDIVQMPEISQSDAIQFDIEKLKENIEKYLNERQQLQTNTVDLKDEKIKEDELIVQLRAERKIKERIHLVLENPDVNYGKMMTMVTNTQERIDKLKEQWNEHRDVLNEQLEKARLSSTKKYSQTKQLMDQIKSTRDKAEELTEDLKSKVALHSQLIGEFEKSKRNISRNAYTSRILEIVGNIRKQKTDIDKVLDDTRELQKEINNISGQLDRQFTVTDDLLFKNAKRDEPSKKAYKLLATLHSNCGDLVSLVQETGQILREVRDLEDQIEQERSRNAVANLEQITNDLQLVVAEAQDIQTRIAKQKQMSLTSSSAKVAASTSSHNQKQSS